MFSIQSSVSCADVHVLDKKKKCGIAPDILRKIQAENVRSRQPWVKTCICMHPTVSSTHFYVWQLSLSCIKVSWNGNLWQTKLSAKFVERLITSGIRVPVWYAACCFIDHFHKRHLCMTQKTIAWVNNYFKS